MVARRVKKKLRDSWPLFLWYIDSEAGNQDIADMFGLRIWEVSLWRRVLTEQRLSREIEHDKPQTPLRLIHFTEERAMG